jgi:hypothetical protein
MADEKYSKEELVKAYAQLIGLAKSLMGYGKLPLKAAGKEPHDYASEAITRFLEEPEKFDRTKRTLLGYLTNHFLRYLISDDFKNRKRDKKIMGHHDFQDRHELIETSYLIRIYLDEKIDYDFIVPQIISSLQSNEMDLKVYNSRYLEWDKIDDICKNFGIARDEVYKSIKRIERVLYKVVKKNNLDESYGK